MAGEAIRVLYRSEGTSWWTELPDIEGWSAAAGDLASLGQLAVEGIPFALGREVEFEHFIPEATP